MTEAKATLLRHWRIMLAIVLSPLMTPIIYLAGEVLFADTGWRRVLDPPFLAKWMGIFLGTATLSYLVTLGLGLPLIVLLGHMRLRTTTMIVGTATGCAAVLAIVIQLLGGNHFDWLFVAIGAGLAALHSGAFALIGGFPLTGASPVTEKVSA